MIMGRDSGAGPTVSPSFRDSIRPAVIRETHGPSAMTGGTSRTVFTAQWVFPMSSPPIVDGAVVVEGARISFVGRAADLPATFDTDVRVALGQAVLMPGLVNVHTHLEPHRHARVSRGAAV